MKSQVVSSYLHQAGLPASLVVAAEMMFDDLLLLLEFIHRSGETFFFTKELQHLDDLWHVFILHTRLYDAFCRENLGQFMHHDPTPDLPPVPTAETKTLIESQGARLRTALGPRFVYRVYVIYPSLFQGVRP